MRRTGVTMAALATLSALSFSSARPASAQFLLAENSEGPHRRYHSPQNFAAQLTFGPYRPDIDSEFTLGRHPYADFYGTGRRLLTQIEVDYQVWHEMGSLGVGLSAGLFRASHAAPLGNNSGALSADSSTLTVIPLSVSAVYRFDYFLERDNFPLVPHAKLGLDWAYWSNTDGNGEIASSMGGRARGGTLGWHATLGAALVLDFIDPDTARDFDVEMGVNHTALVFEYSHYDISGLGRSDRLHLGDTTWTLGLLFEF